MAAPRQRLAFRLFGLLSGEAEGTLAIICLVVLILGCVIVSRLF